MQIPNLRFIMLVLIQMFTYAAFPYLLIAQLNSDNITYLTYSGHITPIQSNILGYISIKSIVNVEFDIAFCQDNTNVWKNILHIGSNQTDRLPAFYQSTLSSNDLRYSFVDTEVTSSKRIYDFSNWVVGQWYHIKYWFDHHNIITTIDYGAVDYKNFTKLNHTHHLSVAIYVSNPWQLPVNCSINDIKIWTSNTRESPTEFQNSDFIPTISNSPGCTTTESPTTAVPTMQPSTVIPTTSDPTYEISKTTFNENEKEIQNEADIITTTSVIDDMREIATHNVTDWTLYVIIGTGALLICLFVVVVLYISKRRTSIQKQSIANNVILENPDRMRSLQDIELLETPQNHNQFDQVITSTNKKLASKNKIIKGGNDLVTKGNEMDEIVVTAHEGSLHPNIGENEFVLKGDEETDNTKA